MKNEVLRTTLIKELGITELPKNVQDEIIVRLGEIVLKSATLTIFDKLSPADREEFEKISKAGNHKHVQEFLEHTVPDISTIMEEELKKTIESFKKGERLLENSK
ncbi:MAG: DUF5663 domain-containing protein [Candidatus Pacebacteria bacterium]|nr:DUF5663 domain-containing protein [Candidatus Paceibacterota bacterium]